jgi:flagellar hook-associated protein 1 FlgK
MSSLSSSLGIAVRALLAEQGAIETTSNNIANVNTPGYARQRPDLVESPPAVYGNMVLGTGVQLDQVTSLRDSILELRLHQETQQQGKLDAFLGSAQQIQTLFNDAAGSGLQGPLTAFFNSLLQLSTSPSDINLRQGVLTAAGNLANAFNSTAANAITLQHNVDRSVTQSVNEINDLTGKISAINGQVSTMQSAGQNPGALVDQRDQLIRQLAGLVDLSVIDAGHGSLTLTTSGGSALVVGNQNFQLTTQADTVTGLQHVFSLGKDLTSSINGGALAGQLQTRDQEIPSVLSSLDMLAASLANSFNAQHQAGFDLNGAAGGNFFVPPLAGGVGAAASLKVAITDPSKIAASGPGSSGSGSAGDNANANALHALQGQAIVNGQSPLDFYSGMVFRLGNDLAAAQSQQQTQTLVLQQLGNMRGAVSGVSLDEEAANLMRFQRAFEAAARVATVVDTLTLTAINLGQD